MTAPDRTSAGGRRPRPAGALGTAAALLALSACTAAQDSPAPAGPSLSAPSATGEPTVVARDLDAPWSVTFHEGLSLIHI